MLSEPRSRARLDAMMARIEARTVETLPDEALEARLSLVAVREELERAGLDRRAGPKEVIAFAHLPEDEVFPGYSWRELRSARRERRAGVLCHTAVEIQSVVGCPFDCTYCPYTSFICIRLDVENFVERVARLAIERRGQSLYKLNNRSDTLGLEPEYGLAAALVQRFAQLDGKYLMLYSKGDAVSHLLDLDHRGKTVASFTLTPESIAQQLEVGAPSPANRIVAMGRLAAAGYPIRVRLSPIVPVRGWRDVYRDLIARLCAVATPEMITLWSLSMVNFAELDRIVPIASLDRDAVAAARAAEVEMSGQKGAPFPPDYRAGLYAGIATMIEELSPTTRVSLCLESEEVWNSAGGHLVPRDGARFLCNCGPNATPDALVPLRRTVG